MAAVRSRPRDQDSQRGDAVARPDTRWLVSSDRPKCRVNATCVRDHKHCGQRFDKRRHSSAPDCAANARALRGSRAGRRGVGKKIVSCVTTRRRKWQSRIGLRRNLGPLSARAFCLSVPGLDLRILSSHGLPPCRLPPADQATAFRLLTVALVPNPWLILPPTPFAQTGPLARSPRSSRTAVLTLNLVGAQGRVILPREKPGESVPAFSPGASNANQTATLQSKAVGRNKTENKTKFARAFGKRRKATACWVALS